MCDDVSVQWVRLLCVDDATDLLEAMLEARVVVVPGRVCHPLGNDPNFKCGTAGGGGWKLGGPRQQVLLGSQVTWQEIWQSEALEDVLQEACSAPPAVA